MQSISSQRGMVGRLFLLRVRGGGRTISTQGKVGG